MVISTSIWMSGQDGNVNVISIDYSSYVITSRMHRSVFMISVAVSISLEQ